MKAKVRGIYTTALTKLLLEKNFQIVQPSPTIKERFYLQEKNETPDIKVEDRHDLQGVIAFGTAEATAAFRSILHSVLEDSIIRIWDVSVDGIYKGKIAYEENNVFFVDIGNGVLGLLPKSELSDESSEEVIVQVKREKIGQKNPALSTELKFFGSLAILIQKGKIGVSIKISNPDKRAELYELGKDLAPEGWGIIWRGESAYHPREVLEKEVSMLNEKVKTLKEMAACKSAPSLLIEGSYFMNIEFPYLSKKKLDELRASATSTIQNHHFYKSCGGKVSAALEMAEKLLANGRNKREVEQLFKNQIEPEFPSENSVIDVEHVKLSGITLKLGRAVVETLNEKEIQYCRTIKSDGFYDGLDVAKVVGDKAISHAKFGDWHITTNYFSKEGKWKGAYINLNTPLEVYPKAIRYVDLEVDICIHPDFKIKVVDMEKLEKAYKKGVINQRLFENIRDKVKALVENQLAEKPSLNLFNKF
ncbi:MAG: ribonuclease E/G [Candidatus Bathyarchaeia archaeon]